MESVRAAGLSRTDAALCDACSTELPAFACATAFGDYGGSLRTLIHLHKFGGLRALAVPLGQQLALAMARACAGKTGTLLVVAVPLYRGKRAFNQSEQMANEAVRVLRREPQGFELQVAHGLLRRTRRTESQVHLTPQQREKNVRGAFAVTGDVKGHDVVLVDDVYTTGATVAECTRVLLRAGAGSVRVATLARTQRELASVWEPVPRNAAPQAAMDVATWSPREAVKARAETKHQTDA